MILDHFACSWACRAMLRTKRPPVEKPNHIIVLESFVRKVVMPPKNGTKLTRKANRSNKEDNETATEVANVALNQVIIILYSKTQNFLQNFLGLDH